jgi:RNA polymerase sigma-70 factor, ECF subfamily
MKMEPTQTGSPPTEAELFAAATAGSDNAFESLVAPHRARLHAHCYRMLGSVHDADDALQEALLRAWRALGRFEGRSATATWLHTIATRTCLDAIAKRPKRVLPIDYGPASEPTHNPRNALPGSVWIEPYPDREMGVEEGYASPEARWEEREAVELAFIAALQHLPARQRAALILRDVLGFSARETAEALETSEASVNSALQRARRTVDRRLPERTQQATTRALGDRRVRELVERFSAAFESGDVEAILAMLAEDVSFEMPPYSEWCEGRDAVGESWLMPSGPAPRLRYSATSANNQLALGTYAIADGGLSYEPIALDVLELGEGGITRVLAFRDPSLFARFGLPERM